MQLSDYDIGAAFEAIENELMASMIRNIKKHRVWEDKEGFHWEQWQALQLRALEEYKTRNQKTYGKQFRDINSQIGAILREARAEGGMNQEIVIMNAIRNGFNTHKVSNGATAEFFKLNDRKLDALIKATTDDMQSAETAVLRMANDQYRKVIYNAQVYANSGAGTYEKAVDMATKSFLSAGLNCIEYANGARHTVADYADMAIRTASKRAYLQGEGEMRQKWGISTVIMNKRGNPCPKCLPFCGKVLIDDVWSGGPKDGKSPETGIKYPLMSEAIAAGLYHPRCKDSHTTYFEGISTPPDDKYTREELDEIVEQNRRETRQQYAERQAEKYGRLTNYSLDGDNQKNYRKKANTWMVEAKNYSDKIDFSNLLKEFKNNDVGNQAKEFYHSLLDVENENVYQLLQQSYRRTKVKRSDKRRSYFSRKENTVYLAKNADKSTLAHELFHEIDNTYGITDSGALSAELQKDYERLHKISRGKSIEDMLYSRYPDMFDENSKHLSVKNKYRGISDILNGLSGGNIKLGYGHSRKYWEKEKALEKETWAQYGRMYYSENDKTLKILREILPDTTKEFEHIIERMMK